MNFEREKWFGRNSNSKRAFDISSLGHGEPDDARFAQAAAHRSAFVLSVLGRTTGMATSDRCGHET